jgi:hypothetical protein
METCDACPHLIRHHYDDGCGRCDCTRSNAELSYKAVLAEPLPPWPEDAGAEDSALRRPER